MKKQEFEEKVRSKEYSLIIFGAGRWGERLSQLCELNNISVACFCDESPDHFGTEKNGFPVFSLAQCLGQFQHPIFIISPKRKEIQGEISLFLEKQEGKIEFYSITTFMQEISVLRSETVMDKIWINRFKLDRYKNKESEVLYLQSIDLMITEQCSLKCKDCGHLMQYYSSPKHRKKEEIFAYLDRIDQVFDVIGGVQILGGEPLMNQEVYEIVEYAQSKESIETVHVVTNATILPKKEKMGKFNPTKVDFVISDYENERQKIPEIRSLLGELGISCDLASSGQWIDYADIKDYQRDEENLKELYRTCNTKNTSVLSHGKLYICPRLANAHTLHAMPEEVFQYVDLMDETKEVSQLKEELKKYFYGTTYLKACNYCNGAAIPTLPKALQVKEPLQYKDYSK